MIDQCTKASTLVRDQVKSGDQPPRPSRARYWVIVFAVALAVLSYIDRVAISQAAGPISRDLSLSKSAMGLVFGAFGLSYSLFEVPTGWLGDWIGARKVLMRVVLWWSAFTALTGAAWNFASLWIIRFLFGAGEAGCFPNITKMFSVWLPLSGRATAQGIMWASARWGGAFTPPLVIFAFHHMTWRAAFAVFGALGLVWIAAFALWFRYRPADHPAVNAAERALLSEVKELGELRAGVPWRRLIAHRSLWLLWMQYFTLSFGWYFYVTWLPTYLQEFRHQTPESAETGHLPFALRRLRLPRLGIPHIAFSPSAPRHRHRRNDLRRSFDRRHSRHLDSPLRHARHGRRQLRKRPRGPRILARLHERRRPVLGNGFRIDEHDGESCRFRCALVRRIPARSQS